MAKKVSYKDLTAHSTIERGSKMNLDDLLYWARQKAVNSFEMHQPKEQEQWDPVKDQFAYASWREARAFLEAAGYSIEASDQVMTAWRKEWEAKNNG